MAAYRADIEIGVKGIQQLQQITKQINTLSVGVDSVNKSLAGASQSIDAYNANLSKAAATLNKVNAGTIAETNAVRQYVQALGQANAARDRQNRLIQEQIALQRRAVPTANAGFGVQGPALPPAARGGGSARANIGSAASNAIIGGAFPLLFGQGAGAAIGGGLGGAVGGAFGGTLGFGLSLVGTAIGQAIDDAQKLNRELTGLNNNLSSTGDTSRTTASDVSQLASQLGIAKDEALKLVSAFSEFDSASVREALAISFGAVGGEEAFNALAAAIDNKSTLEAIVKLRDVITDTQAKEALKQLEINGSASANVFLQERLLQLQEQKLIKQAEEVTILDRLLAGFAALGAQGQFIAPETFGRERAEDIRKTAAERKKAQQQALKDTRDFLLQVNKLNEQFTPKRSRAAAKGPEDRTVSLQADLDAITKIGNAENLIRDFLFQGRETLAAEVELSKTLDDIERDRIKQLQQANFESEKAVINKIAFVRESIAEQVLADKLREINSRRFKEELDAQEAVRNSIKVFTDLRKEREQEAQYGKTYLKLLRDGVLPAEAARLANFEKLVTEQLSAVEEQIKITELAILEAKARGASTVELEKQLKIFKAQQEAIKGEAQKGPGQGPTQKERLEEAIATSRGELNELVDPINQIVNGAKAIGSAFADAFRGLVSGALTGQQALAAFFKNVGDYFLETASQIIAKLIEIYILETIVGFISGAATGSFQAKSSAAGKATFGGSFKGTGSSTFGSGGIRIPGFAEGGFVTGPTRALIGEGGEPEYVIPASKMAGAMTRYAAGIRGGGVIDGAVSDNRNFLDSLTTGINGSTVATSEQPADAAAATRASLRETERFRETQMQVMNQQTERERRFERERMEQMASTPGNLNIRYESQVINNVEYVTREQAERLAAQSALRGRELAINSLQTSVKTRKRVGMA